MSSITAGDRIGLRRSSSRTIHVTVPTAGGRVRRAGIDAVERPAAPE
jgi:hypothetical protein